METFSQAASSLPSSRSSKPSANAVSVSQTTNYPSPLPKSATDELWMRMASRYGHAWVSQYGPMPDGIAAAEWRGTLAGLTGDQMREGFDADAMRAAEWPPSSSKFRALCLGIPSLGSIRLEIDNLVKYSKHHQGIILSRFARGTWSRIDSYRFRNSTNPDRLLREAYELTREFVMEGGTLPVEPVARIEAPKDVTPRAPIDPAIAKDHMRRIADLLKTEPAIPHTEVDA